MLKLLAILFLLTPGCAWMRYERASTVTVMAVGTNTVVTTNMIVRFAGWSVLKDYAVRGTNAFLGAGQVSSDTDAEALESTVRGGVEGVGNIFVPKPNLLKR
jgi:hypothetical protein